MLSFDRRHFLLAAASSVALTGVTFSQEPSFEELATLPPIPDKYAALADQPPMNSEFADVLQPQGTGRPSQAEIAVADEIVKNAPTGVAPLYVAGFLLEVARGTHGRDWRPYTRAWPKDAPANPLILRFFSETATVPEGDTTAWCAAFLNWCLVHAYKEGVIPAGSSAPTKSAASKSFRNWGADHLAYDAASNSFVGSMQPHLGDLAVFQTMKNGKSQNSGHVAFLLDMDRDRVKVLGGNQFEGQPVVHAINAKWMPKRGILQLHSIRTDPSLMV